MKKISVIVPVYNVGEYLQKCLDSILQQQFTDYEIICVDDASTDNSKEILDIYEKQYDIIQVIKHPENKGLSAARNTGLERAMGKYVWFVDSDDMICSNSLAELYDMAEKYKTDMICFTFSNDEKDKKAAILDDIYNLKRRIYLGKELFCLCVHNKTWQESVCIKFIKRSFLIKNEINFFEGLLHEDVLFSFFCIMQAERVISINNVYYIYNKRATSITAQKLHKSAESNLVIMMQLIVYWYTHNLTDKENYAMKEYIYHRYNTYQYYNRFGLRSEKLEVGGPVDKALYDILYNMKMDRRVAFSNVQLEHISNKQNVIVYGAAHVGADVVDILKENEIKVNMIAVSSMNFNPTIFCGIPVDSIEHITKQIKEDTVIVLGVSLKNSIDAKYQLETLGYTDIVVPKYKEE